MLKVVVGLCLVGVAVCGPPVSRSREEIQKFQDFLESTRTEAGVRIPSGFKGNETNPWLNSGKYQGDMLLDDEQVESMVQQFSAGRNGFILPHVLWPERIIPYAFAADHFNNGQRNYILYIMSIIESYTCIRFRPLQQGRDQNYVVVTGYSNGCYANVGYAAHLGRHTLNLGPDLLGFGCLNGVTIVHEWLHIIGFFHMQSTYNRDDFVIIHWENIFPGMGHNFELLGPNMVSNLGLPYEYESCMHYPTHGFSINGRPTLTARWPHFGDLGQTEFVTSWDFLRVDRLYGCAAWKTNKDYPSIHFNGTTAEIITN